MFITMSKNICTNNFRNNSKKKDFREKHYNRNTTQLHELQSIGRIEIFHQMRKS